MRTVITATEIQIILKLAKLVGEHDRLAMKTKAEVWNYVKTTATTLDRLSRFGLAADVRLPADAVSRKLWFIFKTAKARHAVMQTQPLAGLPLLEGTEQYATAQEG
jgi:hypothetical protein